MKAKTYLIPAIAAAVFFAVTPQNLLAAPTKEIQPQVNMVDTAGLTNPIDTIKNYAVAAVEEGSAVNIRESAGTEYKKVGSLENGSLCYIKERQGDWYKVESGEVTGYIRVDLLTTGEEAWKIVHETGEENMTLASPVTTRDELVEYACQFIGNPYVWGGESLTNGADCSGFVKSVFANYGITLPHSSSSQSGYGTKVELADAQPGDLIFYQRGGRIYHVMIYIGDGQVVHASSAKTGIKISDIQYDRVACAVDLLGT